MIKAGIIGYGKIGKKRTDILKSSKDWELISIADSNGSQKYIDYRDMISKEDLDCVFIAVPHTLTTDIVVDCLNKGLHVFTEKPPGISLEDVIKMKKALNNNPECKLRFGFNHRYYSHIQKAKEIIDSGYLGNLLWMRGIYGKSRLENWRQNKSLGGKGILLSQGIHMLDLFRYLSNKEFYDIKSLVSTYHKDWDKDIEDNVFAIMKSDDGITASIHSSAILWKNTFQLNIGFDKGYIHIDNVITSTRSFGFPEVLSIAKSSDTFFYGNPKEEVYRFGEDHSWKTEIDQFTKTIINNEDKYECSIYDAEKVMEMVDKIYGT
jgi:predicted dehydrogenase